MPAIRFDRPEHRLFELLARQNADAARLRRAVERVCRSEGGVPEP